MAAQREWHEACDPAAAEPDGYVRFGELAPAPAAAAVLSSPLLCHAWAEAIALYWRIALGHGNVDPDQPLYLLDLAPADGRLAFLLLPALQARMAGAGVRICYIACGDDAAELDALASHPWLAPLADSGALDTALWPPRHAAPLRLRAAAAPLACVRNPLVCIGLGYFGALPQELYAIDDGAPFEALVRRDTGPGAALDYRWRPAEPCHAALALLEHYAQRCPGAPLLLPRAACGELEQLAALAQGRFLLLGADPGICSEQQIRLSACPDPQAAGLNVHALLLDQRQAGAATWCSQLDDTMQVLQMVWRDDARQPDPAAVDAVIAALQLAHPDEPAQLAAMAAAWNPAQAQALAPVMLRRALYCPAVLAACVDALHGAPFDCGDSALREWHDVLERTWSNYYPSREPGSFYHDMAVLAARLGHWGLARDCFHTGLWLYGEDAGDLHGLAWCEAATGRSGNAATLLARALDLEPAHAACLALQQELLARGNPPPGHAALIDDGAGLVLEPLHAVHAASLVHQYRDLHIGALTRLPEMTTVADATQWIGQLLLAPGKRTYAVMHACWGFVGVVSVHRDAEAGYFYFWIGSDHQGRGLGQRAAALLLEHEARHGMRMVFTSVLRTNARSRRALDLLGFEALALRAHAPDDDLIFVIKRCAPGVLAGPVACARLREVGAAIGSPLQFQSEQEVCAMTAGH